MKVFEVLDMNFVATYHHNALTHSTLIILDFCTKNYRQLSPDLAPVDYFIPQAQVSSQMMKV